MDEKLCSTTNKWGVTFRLYQVFTIVLRLRAGMHEGFDRWHDRRGLNFATESYAQKDMKITKYIIKVWRTFCTFKAILQKRLKRL